MAQKLFADHNVPFHVRLPVDPASIQHRVTALDEKFLDRLKDVSRSQSFRLSANLFSDAAYELEVRFKRSEDKYDVYYGAAEGDDDSDVILTTDGRIITLSVYHEDRGFQIVPLEEGIYLIEEINLYLSPGCDSRSDEQDYDSHHHSGDKSEDIDSRIDTSNNAAASKIHVLILYSSAVRKRLYTDFTGVEGFLRLIVEECNLAFSESNIDAVITWSAKEVNIKNLPRTYCDVVAAIRNNDVIKKLRYDTKADLVSYILDKKGRSCADCIRSTNGNRIKAFSVVNFKQARQQHSFIHELGHNLGCAHSPPIKEKDCEGAEETARGNHFRVRGTVYRTIMAYGRNSKRILRFSGLGVYYKGVETGTRSRNNAATIRKTAPKVAEYAESVEDTTDLNPQSI